MNAPISSEARPGVVPRGACSRRRAVRSRLDAAWICSC